MHHRVPFLLVVSKAVNIKVNNDTVCMYVEKLCADQVSTFSNKSDASWQLKIKANIWIK
jgi:hypothetical protein